MMAYLTNVTLNAPVFYPAIGSATEDRPLKKMNDDDRKSVSQIGVALVNHNGNLGSGSSYRSRIQ
jgi:hypothetical protein